MNSNRIVRIFLLAQMVLLSSAFAYAAGNPARAALDDALAEAKKWKPDAVLTSVSALSVDKDGRAPSWFYGFYSAKGGGYLNVTAKGRTIDTLQLPSGQNISVPTDFMDSDQVMAEAAKAGLTGDTSRMQLTREAWLVSGPAQKGNLAVWLNPRTAKLIKKQPVQ